MTKTEQHQGFWRELMQAFCTLNRVQWQAPWRAQKTC